MFYRKDFSYPLWGTGTFPLLYVGLPTICECSCVPLAHLYKEPREAADTG